MNKLITLFIATLIHVNVHAQIKSQNHAYKDGTAAMEGYMSWDQKVSGRRSVIIVVPEWNGINELTKKKCDELAGMGYLAFAADVYGKGIRPKKSADASKEAAKYKNNRPLLRQRMNAALAAVKKFEQADTNQIVVIGYCFGGTAALELGRSGAAVKGIVSFHGGLDNPTPADAKNIKAKVLVLHGAIDPHVPPSQVNAFQQEMNEAGIDYQFIAYSNAVHSFTNPNAGNEPLKGSAYNEQADRRSWEHFRHFLSEVIAP